MATVRLGVDIGCIFTGLVEDATRGVSEASAKCNVTSATTREPNETIVVFVFYSSGLDKSILINPARSKSTGG